MTEPTQPPAGPPDDPAARPAPGPAFGPYANYQQAAWQPMNTPTPPMAASQPTQPYAVPTLGPSAPPSNHISNYAAPRARPTNLLIVLAVACLLGIVTAAALVRSTSPEPLPTTTVSSTTAGPGQPFAMPRDSSSTGRWEVVDRTWDASGVSVHVRVTALTGDVSYGFQAFAKGASTATQPSPGTKQPELDRGDLAAGEVADGWIYLELPHAESTLFLTTRDGRAISALPIKD